MSSNEPKGKLMQLLSASLRAVGGVIKTQLLLAGITFLALCAGFLVLDIPLWGLKAFLIALVDMLPLIGSAVVMIPWAVVHLLLGNSSLGAGLLVLYAIIFIGRQVLDPILTGKSIGVHPLFSLLCTVVCTLLFGPWGLLLGSVIAVILKTIFDIRKKGREKAAAKDTLPPPTE